MNRDLYFPSVKTRMLGLVGLSSIALFSSFYLQYVAGYQPCIYCYVLRYLTLGMLALSSLGLFAGRFVSEMSAVLAGLGLVGTGISAYLILDEMFPSASICTACSVIPIILGVSLYYYSIVFMAIILIVATTIFRQE